MSDQEKLNAVAQKKFSEQAIWFLNAMFAKGDEEGNKHAEELYKFVNIFAEFELENHSEGHDLDEMQMHRVFEKVNQQQTMQEMRNHFRSIGVQSFKRISMIYFLIFNYKYDWHEVANAPQGGNIEGINKAKKMLEEVTLALEESQKKAEEAKKATAESKKAETAANEAAKEAAKTADEATKKAQEATKTAEEAAKKAQEAEKAAEEAKKDEEEATAKQQELQKAEDEVTSALNDVKAKEQAKEDKKKQLQHTIDTAGLVAKNKAINELAQLEKEDDLPLRQAKITLEAAKRKAEKATKVATDAKNKAEATAKAAEDRKVAADNAAKAADDAKAAAEEAMNASLKAKEDADLAADEARKRKEAAEEAEAAADKAVEDCNAKVAEAEAFLAEQQKKAEGSGQGAIWWMNRDLEEKKKYMPMRKGGKAKN